MRLIDAIPALAATDFPRWVRSSRFDPCDAAAVHTAVVAVTEAIRGAEARSLDQADALAGRILDELRRLSDGREDAPGQGLELLILATCTMAVEALTDRGEQVRAVEWLQLATADPDGAGWRSRRERARLWREGPGELRPLAAELICRLLACEYGMASLRPELLDRGALWWDESRLLLDSSLSAEAVDISWRINLAGHRSQWLSRLDPVRAKVEFRRVVDWFEEPGQSAFARFLVQMFATSSTVEADRPAAGGLGSGDARGAW